MKKLLAVAAVSVMSLWTAASQAQDLTAEAARGPWTCALEFEGQAQGLQIIIGSFTSQATGTLKCADRAGRAYARKVSVNMETEPVGPNIGLGSFRFKGAAANVVVLNSSPAAILGDYVVAEGRASFGNGVGAFTALHVGQPELTLQVSLQVLEGFGLQAGVTKLTIERL